MSYHAYQNLIIEKIFIVPILNYMPLKLYVISNGNRTEWSPIRSRSRESNLFITSMITDRIGRHKVLLPINHKIYNFREKKNSQVMKERENLR